MLIKAVKSNQHEFTVLCYDGEKHCIVQHEILVIMGELATLFAREIPKSRSSNERSYPTLTNRGELHVPREASGLGRRQLNELLVNTPYFRRHPEYYMDSRIGQSGLNDSLPLHRPQSDDRRHHQCHLDVVDAALTSVQVLQLPSETGLDLLLPGTGPPRLTFAPPERARQQTVQQNLLCRRPGGGEIPVLTSVMQTGTPSGTTVPLRTRHRKRQPILHRLQKLYRPPWTSRATANGLSPTDGEPMIRQHSVFSSTPAGLRSATSG